MKGVGPGERVFVESMLRTMYAHRGIGLAAPQVGVGRRFFVFDSGDGPLAVFNPRVLSRRGSEVMEEGCLSLPGIHVKVRRPRKIRVSFLNLDNRIEERDLCDLPARVFLHETDHLHGRLIIDYAGIRERRRLREPLAALIRKRAGMEP